MSVVHHRYVPWDIEVARLNFGANCGPSAFAAATGREVCRVMRYFAHFEHSPWTNLSQMKAALLASGCIFEVHQRAFPRSGVALVQWLGPWTKPYFFSRWSLLHTHWIAVDGMWVFDHTIEKWQTVSQWSRTTAADFIAQIPSAHGWAIKYGIDVVSDNSGCRESTNIEGEGSGMSWQPELSFSRSLSG